METLKDIAMLLGVVVGTLGVIGGILALPEKLRQFKKMRRPRGDRGTQFYLMSRTDSAEHTILEFLVAEDLMHFLGSFGKAGGSATTLEVECVGEFYRVRMQFPPGSVDSFRKVNKV